MMHHWKLAHGKVQVSSIVNRGSVDRIKKDENFLLLVVVHAYSERIMSVALLGGNIEHLQCFPIGYYWKIMLSSSFSCVATI